MDDDTHSNHLVDNSVAVSSRTGQSESGCDDVSLTLPMPAAHDEVAHLTSINSKCADIHISQQIDSSDLSGNADGHDSVVKKTLNENQFTNDHAFKPSDELVAAIIAQVEYYFSDENLAKDKFLMKHISRDKCGFVKLDVIATFNKMKKLTQDVAVISHALNHSKKLEVNKSGTKVRRVASLSGNRDNDSLTRTVVATNLLDTGMDVINKQFASCGSVVRVRVVLKGELVPDDVRKYLQREADGFGKANGVLALVEYDNCGSAQLACERLTNNLDWRRGLHVSMLVPAAPDKKLASAKTVDPKTGCDVKVVAKSAVVKSSVEIKLNADGNQVVDEMQDVKNQQSTEGKVKKKRKNKRRSRVDELQVESPGHSSGSETDGQGENRRQSSPVSVKGIRTLSPRGTSTCSPANSPKFGRSSAAHGKSPLIEDAMYGEIRARSGSTGAIDCKTHGPSPWVQRRLKAAQLEFGSGSETSSLTDLTAGDGATCKKSLESLTILRQPKGPDGTRGFTAVR
jgi:hypothetical protein